MGVEGGGRGRVICQLGLVETTSPAVVPPPLIGCGGEGQQRRHERGQPPSPLSPSSLVTSTAVVLHTSTAQRRLCCLSSLPLAIHRCVVAVLSSSTSTAAYFVSPAHHLSARVHLILTVLHRLRLLVEQSSRSSVLHLFSPRLLLIRYLFPPLLISHGSALSSPAPSSTATPRTPHTCTDIPC